ncbi:MAG: peptidoglycan DD-metalloendopeptidase family protein [Bacteroidales bacterium]|nr:peptidoglycan DD-metalloendopeptidase family protein [Bacteroidales bacterium]
MRGKRIYIRCILVLFAALLCLSAAAQDTKAQEAKKARLEREIAIIDKQLKENASKSNSMLADLELIRKKISNRKELVAESERQIKKYDDDIYLAQVKINRLQERIDVLTENYAKLVRSAYKNRDTRVWYMYMLASDNLGQAFRRMGYFRNLSTMMKTEAQNIRSMQEELEVQKSELQALRREAEQLKKTRVKDLEDLRGDEKKADAVVKKLQKDKKKYQNQLASKKKEVTALNREIERIVAAAIKPKASGKKTEVDTKLDAAFANNKGKLPWPADGPVVSSFGKHYHPVYKNLELPPNNGIDIALSKGTQIRAVFDGVVKQVMVMPGYNQCVLIQHGNYFTLYCKLKSLNVAEGDKVKTSDVIGSVDVINGQVQLHFEVWKGSKPQNPVTWLKK